MYYLYFFIFLFFYFHSAWLYDQLVQFEGIAHDELPFFDITRVSGLHYTTKFPNKLESRQMSTFLIKIITQKPVNTIGIFPCFLFPYE